ncbi:Sec-independent protein translocase protein TatA [Gammaproteobacteria bacterium]
MGLSGIGFSELLLLFVIVVLLFGTKKLSTLGSDLGTAIRGFRQAMSEGNQPPGNSTHSPSNLSNSSVVPPAPHVNEATVEKSQPAPRA